MNVLVFVLYHKYVHLDLDIVCLCVRVSVCVHDFVLVYMCNYIRI